MLQGVADQVVEHALDQPQVGEHPRHAGGRLDAQRHLLTVGGELELCSTSVASVCFVWTAKGPRDVEIVDYR